MAINWLWNKRNGPGGGTRRLHHLWGRTRLDARSKDNSFARLYHRYRSIVIRANANKNSRRSTRKTASNSNFRRVRRELLAA